MRQHYYNQGQAVIVVTIFLVILSLAVISGFVGPVAREANGVSDLVASKQSYFLSEAGVEDVSYRLMTSQSVSSSETLTLNGSSVTTVTSDVSGTKEVVGTAEVNDAVRKAKHILSVGSGASFNLGMQVGGGGIEIGANSDIFGNVYANGPITSTKNFEIHGDVVSAGPSGLVNKAGVTGNAYAHSITNSTVTGGAYYWTDKTDTTAGSLHPNSVDQPLASMPISDETIALWETQAEAGGQTTCSPTCTISSPTTLGPHKYIGNLRFNVNGEISLNGPIWVVGNIINDSNLGLRVSSAQNGKTVQLIADNPSDRTTSSKIDNNSNIDVYGSGSNSYVMLVSMNNSGELGGTQYAFENDSNMNNNSGPIIFYAPHGTVRLDSNTDVNQLTAYKLDVNANFDLRYESGLVNLIFSSGATGAWTLNDWFEIE